MLEEKKATKLEFEAFIKKAIVALRKDGHKGIHTRNSGFNSAFRKYYGLDSKSTVPIEAVNKLATDNKISMRLTVGGAVIYLPGEYEGDTADKTLGKILA